MEVNGSVFYQFFIFVGLMVLVYFVITKPYFLAHAKRQEHTEGDEEEIERIREDVKELKGQYQKRQRDLNRDLKEIYNKSKREVESEKNCILTKAQKEAHKKINEANKTLENSLNHLRKDISSEVSSVSDEIIKKVLH